MAQVTIQVGVPTQTPDQLNAADVTAARTIPSCVLLCACPQLRVLMQASAGSIVGRPYFWHAGLALWVGLGTDAATAGKASMTATSGTNNGVSQMLWEALGEGAYWCLVKESGAGTAGLGYLSEMSNSIR